MPLIDIAKVILSLLLLMASGLGIYMAFRFVRWHEQLCQMELNAEILRDNAMMELTVTRANLYQLKQRLQDQGGPETSILQGQMIKSAGALVMLAFKKERSMIQWAMVGMNLAKQGYQYFKKRSQR